MDIAQALTFEPPIVKQAAEAPKIEDLHTYVTVAAALMKTAYDLQGDSAHPTAELYSRLLVASDHTPAHQKLAAVVYCALGKIAQRRDELEKIAAGPLFAGLAESWGALKGIGGGTKNVAAPILHTLAALGIGGGGLIGAGVWGTKRLLSTEDQKSREMEIQRDTYRKLTAEVEAELKRRGLKNTPSNTAAAIDYLT